MTKPRGRPPSEATLEMRRMEAMLKSMPEHLPKLTEAEKSMLDESFAHNEKIRQEILKTFKHGRTTPDDHAYAMASIGDASMIGHEQEILDADDEYARRAKQYREEGTRTTRNNKVNRQEVIRGINHKLISKTQSSGTYTVYRVAKMIYDQWDSILPAQKLPGEDSLARRGDGQDRPSVTTISRWIAA